MDNQNDIGPKEVRPDVYTVVSKNVDPVPLWRSNKPPTVGTYEPYVGAQGLAEIQNNGNIPEKVLTMDPIRHQVSANTPSYLGNRRTTFYAEV